MPKLFARTGGHWLFWTGFVYLVLGITFGVYYKEIPAEAIQLVWIMVMMLPFVIPPLGRWLNMKVEWDRKMFDWLKGKNKMPDNVVPFSAPAPKLVEPPPAPKPEPKTYYTFGLTDDNRLSFSMGYSTLTMNSTGVQQLIDQLEFFKSQIDTE